MMRVAHVLVDAASRVLRIRTLNDLGITLDVAEDLSHEAVTSALEHDANGKVGVVVFLLQRGLDQLLLRRHITRLFLGQLLARDLQARDL